MKSEILLLVAGATLVFVASCTNSGKSSDRLAIDSEMGSTLTIQDDQGTAYKVCTDRLYEWPTQRTVTLTMAKHGSQVLFDAGLEDAVLRITYQDNSETIDLQAFSTSQGNWNDYEGDVENVRLILSHELVLGKYCYPIAKI